MHLVARLAAESQPPSTAVYGIDKVHIPMYCLKTFKRIALLGKA